MRKPDQPLIYDCFEQGQSDRRDRMMWRNNLEKKATHKALDIPLDDDMGDTNIRTGMGWKELAVIGSLLVAGIGGSYMLNRPSIPVPVPPVVQPVDPSVDTDTQYNLKFVKPK